MPGSDDQYDQVHTYSQDHAGKSKTTKPAVRELGRDGAPLRLLVGQQRDEPRTPPSGVLYFYTDDATNWKLKRPDGTVETIPSAGGTLTDSGSDNPDGGDIYELPKAEDSISLQGSGEVTDAEALGPTARFVGEDRDPANVGTPDSGEVFLFFDTNQNPRVKDSTGTVASPVDGQAISPASVTTDDIKSDLVYRVIDFDGTEYRNRGFSTLDDALTEQDNLTHPAAVYIPPGSHTFSTQLTLGEKEAIVTDGYHVTELNYEGDASPAFLRETGANFVHVNGGFILDGTNAGSGVVGAEIGGQRSHYDPIRAVDFPDDGIHVFGEQGSGTYSSVFNHLMAERNGGRGVVIRSPAGDPRRVQANRFGEIVALGNTGSGFVVENEQNVNWIDFVDTENNGTPLLDWNGGEAIIGGLWTSDPGAALAVDTAGATSTLTILYEHIEGGTSGNVSWDNLRMMQTGQDTFHTAFRLDHANNRTLVGNARSGWVQRFQTWNDDWEFFNQNTNTLVARINSSGIPVYQGNRMIHEAAVTADEPAPAEGYALFFRSDLTPPELRAVDSAGTVVTVATF